MLFSLVATVLVGLVSAEEQCQTYAGGYVYPQELRPASGHQIQWSKALSE